MIFVNSKGKHNSRKFILVKIIYLATLFMAIGTKKLIFSLKLLILIH